MGVFCGDAAMLYFVARGMVVGDGRRCRGGRNVCQHSGGSRQGGSATPRHASWTHPLATVWL